MLDQDPHQSAEPKPFAAGRAEPHTPPPARGVTSRIALLIALGFLVRAGCTGSSSPAPDAASPRDAVSTDARADAAPGDAQARDGATRVDAAPGDDAGGRDASGGDDAGDGDAGVQVDECTGWQTAHPDWIFCDDFESTTPLVAQGRYFEHDDDDGEFVPVAGAGLGGSRGMRARWQVGEVGAGSLKLGFGRNPQGYMNKGIRSGEDFREIYYRMYLRNQPGWTGSPAKLSRATVFTSSSDWSQAMIAHLWSDSQEHLLIDPASCVDGSGNVLCQGYNDFAHLQWLGNQSGTTAIFATAQSGIWFCVEAHVRLNDPGQQNGVQEFWIDGQLEARRDSLDFVSTYQAYGLNAVFFENYWNNGSPVEQERAFDNIVVSTQRIGCL